VSRGIVIAAPASASGKTVTTLGLIRAFKQRGVKVGSLKIGPDYIDADFHRMASGSVCRTYDPWGMRSDTLADQVRALSAECDLIIAEGVMGLFDGAADGTGSTADAAAMLGWPVVLVVGVQGQGASAAAIIEGFESHRKDISISGVIFNRTGSPRHQRILDRAVAKLAPEVLGHIPSSDSLSLPSRHLGLVQARENSDREKWIDGAAEIIAEHIDLDRLQDLAAETSTGAAVSPSPIPPLGERIAIAHDDAFAFAYPHVLDGWKNAGSSLSFFSPLADQSPLAESDAIYLPGGYPELHAVRLAVNKRFLGGLRVAATRGAAIYGECGGFMVLGEALTDADGTEHAMAGLLPVKTSFAMRGLHLGYRRLRLAAEVKLGPASSGFRGHEFHYATLSENRGAPLFEVSDAEGETLSAAGAVEGSVSGSFIHLLDREAG